MVDLLRKILKWSDVSNWHSWIVHMAISVPMVVLLTLWMLLLVVCHAFTPYSAAASGVVFHYLTREGEQIAHELMSRVPIYFLEWVDHFMDVFTVAALLYGIDRWLL